MTKKLTSFRIALIYLLVGVLWITISDELLLGLIKDPQLLSTFQTYKGWLYIVVTALLLYGVIKKYTSSLEKTQNMLRSERERFEMATRACSDVVWDWDVENNRHWLGEGYKSQFGYEIPDKKESLYTWLRHIHPDDRPEMKKKIASVQEYKGNIWETNYRYITADGSVKYIRGRGHVVRNDEGKVTRMVGAMIDKTEEKKAREKLKQSERYYRNIFEKNAQPMWIYDPDTLEFLLVNQAAINHYGYTQEEFLQMKITKLFTAADVGDIKKMDIRKQAASPTHYTEVTHLKKDDSEIIVNISGSDVPYSNKTCRLVQIFDITKQKQLREQLIRSLIKGEDRERRRIARDLHDGLGQYLVAASMDIESVKDDINILPPKRIEQFKKGLSLLKQSLAETRRIAHKLMPQVIDDYGLIKAVQNLVDGFRESSKIAFKFNHEVDKIDLSNQAEINLYRILQEAVQNAVKHAGCDEIKISIFYDENTLICSVEDNGVGFDGTHNNGEYGLGLQSIKTRANVLNGTVQINSSKRQGTSIKVEIPGRSTIEKR